MYRILLVEDDPIIARLAAGELEKWGDQVETVTDFARVMEQFSAFDPQLVLMDISLPRMDGYHWCREIRKVSRIPVVFLSSAADNLNIVMAMEMGGDDFIAKPFDLAVLRAKVNAVLRRSYDFSAPGHVLKCGEGLLDLGSGTVRVGDAAAELTRNESRILQVLLERRGDIVSRGDLMAALWESEDFVDENTLTVNIARLRRKLEGMGLTGLVRTRKGEGYMVE